MIINPTTYTVAQYCKLWKDGDLKVNREYQRNEEVWPPAARSFLIETLLLGYPIPKLYLYQHTDLKTKRTVLEVVDGQQRTTTIFDFYTGKLKLSKRCSLEEARGKAYDGLSDDLQKAFLNYGVPVDLFVSATHKEIREVFRRINAYTVPLNAEEKRHATFQGAFKWFIYEVTKAYGDALEKLGVFTEKQLVRMQDAKLLSDFAYGLKHGIETTKAEHLNALYEELDEKFPEEAEYTERIKDVMDFVLAVPTLHHTSLMKPHVFYSLSLALTHAQRPVKALQSNFKRPKRHPIKKDVAAVNLSILAEAVENGEERGPYKRFVRACEKGTNVAEARIIRFQWLSKALEQHSL